MSSTDGPPAVAPGTEVAAGYRVIAHLSRGRLLDVHDAWSETRGTRCIVKMLRPDRARDASAARRLVAEGRLIRRLSHPHIVRGYEVVTAPRPLVVMETLTGRTLSHVIDESPRRLPLAEIAHLGLHLGSAIRYLHGEGWLHLDLKPSNVVAEAGRAKLIDMSVARRPGRAPAGVGTWGYLAPEQAAGGVLGPPADVWGLGAVLYEATTGEAAFDPSTSDGEPLGRAPVPVRRLRRAPAPLVALIDACLDHDPARRPPVDRVLGALEPLAGLPRRERRFGAGSTGRS